MEAGLTPNSQITESTNNPLLGNSLSNVGISQAVADIIKIRDYQGIGRHGHDGSTVCNNLGS